jgi:hypothetical protein
MNISNAAAASYYAIIIYCMIMQLLCSRPASHILSYLLINYHRYNTIKLLLATYLLTYLLTYYYIIFYYLLASSRTLCEEIHFAVNLHSVAFL